MILSKVSYIAIEMAYYKVNKNIKLNKNKILILYMIFLLDKIGLFYF